MTELQKLQHLIETGYQPFMILREIMENEVKQKLPKEYFNKDVYALPLIKFKEDDKLMFYMVEPETIIYSKKLVEEAKVVIGYNPVVYCTVLSKESAKGQSANFSEVIKTLNDITGWKVEESQYPNTLEVRHTIEPGTIESLDSFINEVKNIVKLIAIKNHLGFQVSAYSPGEYTKGQPFGITFGLQSYSLHGITKDEIELFKENLQNELCKEAIDSLQLIYSQISNSSKLTICWATIEHLFSKKPKHLLEKKEISNLCNIIQDLNLNKEQQDKLIEIIKNPNLVCVKNRNVRIAENIAETLNLDFEHIYKEIRNMTRTRGKMVHALGNETDISLHLKFVEKILSIYIQKQSGIDIL